MTQQELKSKIENNTLDDSPLVLKYKDNNFVSLQYAKTIAKNRGLQILKIDDLNEVEEYQDEMFDTFPMYLYIYDVEELKCNIKDKTKNLIIICKKISFDNLSVDYIDILPLVNWQIEDFMQMRLPGLSETQIKWLCSITKYDIFRLDNECKKLEIFPTEYQKIIFDAINNDNGYRDLNNLTIFDLTNAVMKKDSTTIGRILANIEYIDVEPVGLVSIFKGQLKKLIDIQLNPKATPELLGISPKQFSAIKYGSLGIFNQTQLVNMYDFITGIDFRLKNGDLQFNKDNKKNNYNFIDYIITNLMMIGNRQSNSL